MKLLVEMNGREQLVDTAAGVGPAECAGSVASGAQAEEVEPGVYSVIHEGLSYEVIVRDALDGSLEIHVNGRIYTARVRDPRKLARRRAGVSLEGAQTIIAPMPGKVVRLLVGVGDTVESGQGLVVVEAMKMQNEIKSPKAGKVIKITAAEGATVNPGQALLIVE